jgi:phosphoribosylamine--glycine ligase
VIEEYLTGQEISFMVATDGKNFVSFLPSQDHKKIFENDQGPNTGGMGAYAPIPYLSSSIVQQIEETIVAPLLKALADHGNPYSGILYPGIILTRDGPKVLEFNCRFGDPETQPLMVLLKNDIIDLFLGIINKQIKKVKLNWYKGYSVCTVLAAKGYPGKYRKNDKINNAGKTDISKGLHIFQAGTKRDDDKIVTVGGRVLGITSYASTLKTAIAIVNKFIENKGIHYAGMQYRNDIGYKGLNKQLWK